MIIESVDVLKAWLAKLLEPICDADPSALANYVVALVKKDKPEKELRALCADQLDVFLQKETTSFVEKLFESLTTKNYLGNPPAKDVPKEETKAPAPKPAETEEVAHVEDEKEIRRRRSPLRNRSDFNESRNRDERRREERRRREPERHGKSGEMYRERERERERNERRGASSRGRSRSRSRSSSRGKSRDCEQRREHRPKFDQERKEPEAYNALSSAPLGKPQQQQPPQLPLLPLPHPRSPFPPSGSPSIPSSVTAHLPDSTTENWTTYYSKHCEGKSGALKHRCRDYDEKGFCVRGDLCPFDHGNDPLIVDDVALPTMIPFPPPGMPPARMPLPLPPMPEPLLVMPMPIPPHGQPPPPGIYPMAGPPLIPVSGIETPPHARTSTSSPLAPPGVNPPPPPPPPSSAISSVSLHPQYTLSEYNYDPEAYNPESPAITGAGRAQYRQFIPRIQTQRPNLIGLTSGDNQSSRAANIVIQTEPLISNPSSGEGRHGMELESRKRPLESGNGPQSKKPWTDKQNFNNQHKPVFGKKNHYVNTKLEVRRIPRDLNNITKLNEHFSKFGTIVNIQVVFSGDPEAALIQYTANEEARRAISSTEAVLNNRFIRVYWHRENTQQNQEQNTNQNSSLNTHTHTGHKLINKPHTHGAYVLNKSFPNHQSSSGNGPAASLELISSPPESSLAAVPAHAVQKGLYSRTVFKPVPKTPAKTPKALEDHEDVLKKKQEALKLQQDMRKKKREMLEKQIEYQKVLINRLEKNRGMKPEERANIMKTLKELTEKISQLKNEISNSSVSQSAGGAAPPKTKTDAQKELLDAELDFHKKLTTGEDTTDLKKRLGQLQVEAKRLGLLPGGRAKPPVISSRSRGRGRGRSGRGRGAPSHMVVDHRPRTLAILGVTQEEKEELMPHFVKFGEIEELRDQDATSVVLTFKTRSEAENAANQGAKFKGRLLQISWYKPKTPSVTTEPKEVESNKEINAESVSPFLLPEEEEEDEDEDDDYESRSWRR